MRILFIRKLQLAGIGYLFNALVKNRALLVLRHLNIDLLHVYFVTTE